MSPHDRTFQVQQPPLRGDDVAAWQTTLNRQMRTWHVDYRIESDGVYGAVTRDLTASVCHGLGLASAAAAMEHGVTPALRVKLRSKRLTPAELRRFDERAGWREAFRRRHASRDVTAPLAKIISSSWGYHPPVHDGVDLICGPRAAGLAICKARVVRADDGGWWGKGAPSPEVAAKGDGIVVLRSLVDVEPFRVGLNFCYGHAERVRVRVGDVVEAGQVVCEAGFANAWHFHFMVNGRDDTKGVGDRDPMPYLDFATAQG
ncbi:MAG TPA: hypothetical protein VN238_00175 [Solirubrobacteraceae bacterium]|nr:hypothetical protein [Solirubrobacteraceae bacterium]